MCGGVFKTGGKVEEDGERGKGGTSCGYRRGGGKVAWKKGRGCSLR